jgi:PAS domain S-box-containing protein
MVSAELINKLKELESIFSVTGDLIWAMDLKGNYKYCTPSILAIREFTPEEILSRNMLEDVHPDEHEKIKKIFFKAMQTIKYEGSLPTHKFRTKVFSKSGQIIWLDVVIDYFCNKAKKVEGFFGIGRDITELVKKEEETQTLLKNQQKALNEVKLLQGLLPICSSCKKVKTSDGYWTAIDEYLSTHRLIDVSHGLCDECLLKIYPQFGNSILEEQKETG